MILLSEIGVNIAPLLAGAGALGLAISFGAQTRSKTLSLAYLSSLRTDEHRRPVTIGPLTGTVERMSIRSVGVRQDTGAYHIIPRSRSPPLPTSCAALARLWLTMTLTAMRIWIKPAALKAAVDDLLARRRSAVDHWRTVVRRAGGLSNTAFTLRVSFTTLPLKQWTVRFALDTREKHFDRAGVRAPVQTGSSCRCRAPTARPPSSVRMDDGVWRRP